MPLDADPQPGAAADRSDAADRLAFLRIDDAAIARLRAMEPMVKAALPAIAEEFYRFVGRWPDLAAKLGNEANIARLRKAQTEHWDVLFSGALDADFFARAEAIGRVHGRILLVGDASGYLDALTGEGLGVGLAQADVLARCLAAGQPAAYERAWRRVSGPAWLPWPTRAGS